MEDRPVRVDAEASKVDALGQQFDKKFEALGADLENLRRSISQSDALIAAMNARLDHQLGAAAQSTQQTRQPDVTSQNPGTPAPIRQESIEPRSDASTRVDQLPANQQWYASAQVDQQTPAQQGDSFVQVDHTPANQQLDAPTETKQKFQTADQQPKIDTQPSGSPSEDLSPPAEATNKTPKAAKSHAAGLPHLGIGVAALNSRIAGEMGSVQRHGVLIAAVDPGSPADKAGVQASDILLKVDGTAVSKPDQLRQALISVKGKHSLTLTLNRNGRIEHVKLTLG
jgi:PDZ domain